MVQIQKVPFCGFKQQNTIKYMLLLFVPEQAEDFYSFNVLNCYIRVTTGAKEMAFFLHAKTVQLAHSR